ncbi:MAG TPA: FAD-binding oxidoreductase [Enteractinococcus helveticum]|uniref:FAD-binding oxidoreductase n=1 Tax=Enteractinococcus helveticum TaxID=1837282 RepID=A0A921K795_9MICC|nr:FAD-binding oxidoreductase [Enteractinococcus helveticum]HJF14273.1 FAD-binding oxidoreductase [Enteractinococcus helveticum]
MIIIGGGIAGVSLAAELSERGHAVTLLEAEDQLAYHTSGRSAQQLVLGYGPPAVRELTDLTVEMLLTRQQVLDEPVAWPSRFMMVGTEAEIEAHAYPGQIRQDQQAVNQLLPELRSERFTTGALDTRSLRTRADAMICWLVDSAEHLDIHLGERVTAATRTNGTWQVTTTKATYQSDVVINAAGAWADDIAQRFGISPLGLTPLRRTAAILGIDRIISADRCMMMTADGYYYRYEADDAILASPQEAEPSPAEDAQPRANDIEELIQQIQSDTTLRITGVRSAWTGLRTEAADGVPVVGFDDQHPGFFWLAGQSGYGFQTSLGFARLAGDLIVNGVAGQWVSAASVAALDPGRLR